MAATPNPEFQAYLEAIATEPKYQYWSNRYTSTDTLGKQPLNDIRLMVQTVPLKQQQGMSSEEKEEIERLNVLEAIRKYAVKHVLLVGKPGSGKSTALERLLWEEAQKPLPPTPLSEAERGEEDSPPTLVGKGAGGLGQIPVLVRLREYKTSVLDIIRDFLATHDPSLEELEETDIKSLLLKGQFLLLVDGLNELPNEQAREQVRKFQQKYKRCTPMIFTTRDLSLGGFDFTKQLEMQPLTETEMQAFVRAYLQQQGEQMLRQLNHRLRKFAETPLLLWMLCRVYAQEKGKIPTNLGGAFQDFASLYDNELKRGVPAYENYQGWCSELLQQLAFNMMQGAAPTDFRLNISKGEAQDILAQFLDKKKKPDPYEYAKRWLDDLLKHHLIQTVSNNQIEFRHQLLQEYYAAEYLLKQLPYLSDAKLKRDYLNYLKWTEPLALMLALEEKEAQAMRVVKLALDVDLMLAARLAGEVKWEFQEKTVGLILGKDLPQLLMNKVLGITRSEFAFPSLQQALKHEDVEVRAGAVSALAQINSDKVISEILKALEDENADVYQKVAESLGYLECKEAIPKLREKLADWEASSQNKGFYSDSDIIVWMSIVEALGKLSKQDAISVLRDTILKYIDEPPTVSCFHLFGAGILLRRIDSNIVIQELFEALTDIKSDYRRINAAHILGKIGNKLAVPKLRQALEKENNSSVREDILDALIELDEEAAIPVLLENLQDENNHVYQKAAETLIEVNNSAAISGLRKLLIHTDDDVRWRATIILGKLSRKEALSGLVNGLTYPNPNVRETAAMVLGELGSQETLLALCQALKDKYYYVRRSAAIALAQLDCEEAIPELIKALRHYRINVESSVKLDTQNLIVQGISEEELENLGDEEAIQRWVFELRLNFSILVKVAEALGKLDNEEAISGLIEALEDSHLAAGIALGQLGRKEAIPKLLNSFINSHPELRKNIVEALVKVSNEEVIQEFINALEHNDYEVCTRAAEGLIKIGSPTPVYRLWEMRLKGREDVAYILESIQKSCNFYNYEIFNSPPVVEDKILPGSTVINSEIVQIIEKNDGTVIGWL